jgi:toxin FitB
MFFLDRNVISEHRNRSQYDPAVARWYRGVREDEIFLSVLVTGEIRQGIERLRPRNSRHAQVLENWLAELLRSFGDRILPVEERTAQHWGASRRKTFPVIDSLLAGTAVAHNLTLVTRNIRDIERSGVRRLDPFEST